MPIISIIQQPEASEVKAAYRPISFIVRANRTDASPLPPVVYCDIYVAGVFYKTQEKTQCVALNATDSDWKFDIQDACQEVLKKILSANGNTLITSVPEAMKAIYCKFRSSGFDGNGFITSEGTRPTQQTGRVASVGGTGTQSNTFFAVNSVLQHESNQTLSTHLNSHKKNGTWASATFPLTHRPNGYKVAINDSDVFPIIHLGPNRLQCLKLSYKYKGQSTFSTKQNCPNFGCNIHISGLSIVLFNQPPDTTYVVYHAAWTVTGDPLTSYTKEFSLDGGATWNPVTEITVSDAGQLNYSLGTDTANETHQNHRLRITPIGGLGVDTCASAVGIYTYTACVSVGIVGSPVLPNGAVGVPYNFVINLSGTPPFTIYSPVKPAGMTITVVGSTLVVGGTPTTATDTPTTISFTVGNCYSDTVNFSDTIDIDSAPPYISNYLVPIINNGCRSVFRVHVNATIGDELTISTTLISGNYFSKYPITPLDVTFAGTLIFFNELDNAAGDGITRLQFTVFNHTTGITQSVNLDRNNDGGIC
jgi:hypothetical protein